MKAGWMTMPLAFVATFAFLFAVSTSGAGVSADPDGDGHQNDADNCTAEANASQTDTDEDGYGNACDGDFDQNGLINITDFGTLKLSFNKFEGDPAFNEDVDCNDDGAVGIPDFGCFKKQFSSGTLGASGRGCVVPTGSVQFGGGPAGPSTPCPDPAIPSMPRAAALP